MAPDEMLSLFSGFITASFLIWFTHVCTGEKYEKVHGEPKPPQNKHARTGHSETTPSWNVSAFFGLHRP